MDTLELQYIIRWTVSTFYTQTQQPVKMGLGTPVQYLQKHTYLLIITITVGFILSMGRGGGGISYQMCGYFPLNGFQGGNRSSAPQESLYSSSGIVRLAAGRTVYIPFHAGSSRIVRRTLIPTYSSLLLSYVRI